MLFRPSGSRADTTLAALQDLRRSGLRPRTLLRSGSEAGPLSEGAAAGHLLRCVLSLFRQRRMLVSRCSYTCMAPLRAVQLCAATLTTFVQVGVKRWLVATVPNLCDPDQKAHLTCPYMRTFFSASSIWCVLPLFLIRPLLLIDGGLGQGCRRTGAALQRRPDVPSDAVLPDHRRDSARGHVVLASTIPSLVARLHQRPRRLCGLSVHPAGDRHQFLSADYRRLHLP